MTPPVATTYFRWRKGESREGRIFPPLTPQHPAATQLCLICDSPLGTDKPIQLFVLGPDDEESRVKHANDRWYSAHALLLHQDCLAGRTVTI